MYTRLRKANFLDTWNCCLRMSHYFSMSLCSILLTSWWRESSNMAIREIFWRICLVYTSWKLRKKLLTISVLRKKQFPTSYSVSSTCKNPQIFHIAKKSEYKRLFKFYLWPSSPKTPMIYRKPSSNLLSFCLSTKLQIILCLHFFIVRIYSWKNKR